MGIPRVDKLPVFKTNSCWFLLFLFFLKWRKTPSFVWTVVCFIACFLSFQRWLLAFDNFTPLSRNQFRTMFSEGSYRRLHLPNTIDLPAISLASSSCWLHSPFTFVMNMEMLLQYCAAVSETPCNGFIMFSFSFSLVPQPSSFLRFLNAFSWKLKKPGPLMFCNNSVRFFNIFQINFFVMKILKFSMK